MFLDTSHSLVLLVDDNRIYDERVDSVGSFADRKGNVSFRIFYVAFQLADSYRLEFPNVPLWTTANSPGTSLSYIDGTLIRRNERNVANFPQSHLISNSNHKLATGKLIKDRLYSKGPGYWKRNTVFSAIKLYRNRIKLLIQRALTGAIISNKWRYATQTNRKLV